jgi:glycosyl hydrolase family 57
VRDHAHRSLALLMRIHRAHRAPVLIAPTGTFLKLCRRDAPRVVDDLLSLYRSGLAEPATTYLHEIDPFNISWMHLQEQIRRDHVYKTNLIGRPPTWFFTPNFAWHPAMDRLLATLGIKGVVLDSRHLASASTARAWKWSTDALGGVAATDTPPFVSPWEHRRLRTLEAETSCGLRLAFRDWPLTRALTFGNDAAIHRPGRDLPAHLADCEPQDLVILADDGDRIGPASRRGYEELLDTARHTVDWQALEEEEPPLPPVRELPAFSQPGFDELLRSSLDARVYWSLLDQIAAQSLDGPQLERLLALQEIFYPFWKGSGRRRWYLDAAIELLEEVQP